MHGLDQGRPGHLDEVVRLDAAVAVPERDGIGEGQGEEHDALAQVGAQVVVLRVGQREGQLLDLEVDVVGTRSRLGGRVIARGQGHVSSFEEVMAPLSDHCHARRPCVRSPNRTTRT